MHDLNSFRTLKRRHEISPAHITALTDLVKFGKDRIEFSLSEAFKKSVEEYNEKVKQNRYILRNLIDAVCYLGKQELAFRGHDEGEESENKGNYKELLSLFAKRDDIFRHHLETSTVFSGVSSVIQNDIIEAISNFMIKEIKNELHRTKFVSIIIDETSDVSNKEQLSTVLRYVTQEGNIVERFIRFNDVSADRSAVSLSNHVIPFINEFSCGDKLIAQTYDGGSVMAGQHGGLQKLIKDEFPQAMFIHCYAHQLNLILQQSLNHIKECKVFFQTLSGFASFFSKSPKRTAALDKAVQRRLPSVAPTRWLYSGRLVGLGVISTVHSDLMKLFDDMKDNVKEWDCETRMCAKGFYTTLAEFDFNFLLNVFSSILPQAEVVFQILQKKTADIALCSDHIQNFHSTLQCLRNDFENIWSKSQNDALFEPSQKRIRITNVGNDKSDSYRRLFYEIVDTFMTLVKSRFSEIKKPRIFVSPRF